MLQPVTFQDFSGGQADRYLSTDITRCAAGDNFWIDETKRPYTRDGTSIFTNRFPTATNSIIPTGLYVGSDPFSHPLLIIGPHAYTLNETSGFTEILGPASNTLLPNKTDKIFETAVQWRRQLIVGYNVASAPPQMVYCSSFANPATYKALTLGLPKLASSPTSTATGGFGSWAYAFYYKYTFTDYLGTQFVYFGNPIFIQVTSTADPSGTPIPIAAIPALANTALTNYDITNVKIGIGRTVNGGSDYFLLTEITNGTTTYSDTTSDTALQLLAPLYTAGGVLGFDQPPLQCVAVAQTNDFFWYATSSTLYQSIQGNPGAVPATNSSQITQKIIGLSDIITFPILFCDKSVFRIEGTFDSFGNNGFTPREISATAGCVSARGIVKIPGGLVWAGNGGFYYTDGYTVAPISNHLKSSYATWNNANMVGEYDPIKNFVHWTVSGTANSSVNPNDTLVTLHLNFGLTPESCFMTSSSQNNLFPTTLAYSSSQDLTTAGAPYAQFRSSMLFTESRGYLLRFDPNSYADPRINTGLFPSQMSKVAIIYNLTTAGLDQGLIGFRKYTSEITCEFENITPLAVQIQHRRDDTGAWSGTGGSPASGLAGSPGGGSSGLAMVPELRQDGGLLWNITDCVWLTDAIEHPWNDQSITSGKRFVPAGILRSGRRQIRFTNSFTVVAGSDYYGTATVDAGGKTVSLDNYPTQIWITDPEDYYITFVVDNYNQTFQIKSRFSDQVLQLYDPYNLLVAGSTKWEIKGYRKFERTRLLSFTLNAEVDGPTQPPATSQTGANA